MAGAWGQSPAWERWLPRGLMLALAGAAALGSLSQLGGGAVGPPAWHLPPLLFLLLNTASNAGLFVVTSPSTRGVVLAGAVGQGWAFCYSCEAPVPPRGRHCPSCRVCVLGRDHHCTLLGQCVGHRNRRYFLGLLLHGAAALLYCSLLHANLLLGALRQGPPLRAAAFLLAPWLLLLSGQSSLLSCTQAVAADACVVGFLLCAGFLLFHVLLLLRGQTTGEWFTGARSHDQGWRQNLREALGPRWGLALLCPLLASPLPGDGVVQERCPAPSC